MKYHSSRDRLTVRYPGGRHGTEIPAAMILEEGELLHARLVNFSRHGARLHVSGTYAAGQAVRLEVAGWPSLEGHVVWNDHGRIGCLFEKPPSHKAFTLMCASATECDREAF